MVNKEIYYTRVYIHEFLKGYDAFAEGNKKEASTFNGGFLMVIAYLLLVLIMFLSFRNIERIHAPVRAGGCAHLHR